MIKTNGDFVSSIRNDLKALNKDDYISARYILSIANSYTSYLINNRPLSKLFRDSRLFSVCDCIELEPVKKTNCEIAEFRLCDKLMRSKYKLPEILVTKLGMAVYYVMNITNEEEYEFLRNAADFKNSKLRQFGNHFKYYYIDDKNYLWLLNSQAEAVNISAAFLSKCTECGEDCDECSSKLDDKFIAPEEFISSVRESTLQVILNGNKRVIEDMKPDLNSNNKGV